MNGYKTFVIAILMLVGSFALIVTGRLDATQAWQWIVGFVSGMVGLREMGDKLLKPLSKPDRLVDQ